MGGMSGMTESEEERLFGDLPEEALAVVAELLSASEREEDRATGRRLEARRGFVLTAGPAAGGGLFAGLPQHPREIRRREPPNPARYAQIDAEDVRRWFADGGTFAQAMPGYESRPEQMRMAGDVAEAFSACRHLIVEAGTGVGKTMAYLVPAVLWSLSNDVPVVVSTNTKNLQDQIFRKDLPLIARMLRTPVRFALIKGRGNYLCLARLERLVDRREAEFGREELPALARAVAWAFRTATGDLSDFDPGPCGGAGEGGGPSVAERAASNAEDCRGRKCPYWSRCFLQKARADSLAADIVITNHAVFFSEPEDKPLALPRAAHVVFDEAHNLEEAATAKFAREASPWTVRRQLRRLHVPRRRRAGAGGGAAPGSGTGLVAELEAMLLRAPCMATEDGRSAVFELLSRARELTDAAGKSAQAWFRALGGLPRSGETQLRLRPETIAGAPWEDTLPALRRFQDDLFALWSVLSLLSQVFHPVEGAPPPRTSGVELMLSPRVAAGAAAGDARLSEEVSEAGRRLGAAAAALQETIEDVEFLTRADNEDWAYWIAVTSERGRRGAPEAGLCAAPVDVSHFLADDVFGKLDCAVLCSATMSVSGSPAFLSRRLGLDRIEPERVAESRLGSPFDYAGQCLAAVPSFLPDAAPGPGGESAAFAEAFGDLLAALAVRAGGRTMALFTSYRMMQAAARRAAPALEAAGIRLLVQGSGPSREALTAAFRDGARPSVLLGTDSFWEGVDLIGDALSCLVIAKLPFPSPGDPLVDARCERIEKDGASAFHDYSLPSAVIKLRQGFGRLIRHKEDRGVVVIADNRLFTKGYGAVFRRNLPAEVRRFADAASLLAAADAFLPRPPALPPPA